MNKILVVMLLLLSLATAAIASDSVDSFYTEIHNSAFLNMMLTGCLGRGDNVKQRENSYCLDVAGVKQKGAKSDWFYSKLLIAQVDTKADGTYVFKYRAKFNGREVSDSGVYDFTFDGEFADRAYDFLAAAVYGYCNDDKTSLSRDGYKKHLADCNSSELITELSSPFYKSLHKRGAELDSETKQALREMESTWTTTYSK
jgi:hypothetical protein